MTSFYKGLRSFNNLFIYSKILYIFILAGENRYCDEEVEDKEEEKEKHVFYFYLQNTLTAVLENNLTH